MTNSAAQMLWIRAHVCLHARCPDSSRWRDTDLIAAFHALPPAEICPFDEWAARAQIQLEDPEKPALDPDPGPPDHKRLCAELAAAFGNAVPLYDPRTKGPLQWP